LERLGVRVAEAAVFVLGAITLGPRRFLV
jgi:hypothetical protein